MLPRAALAAAPQRSSSPPRRRSAAAPDPDRRPTVVPGCHPGPGAQPYQANDGKGFRNILPPGTRGRYNAASSPRSCRPARPSPHCCDQLAMYRDLVYATPGLKAAGHSRSTSRTRSFGVARRPAERTYSPARATSPSCATARFGVPHVYGATRAGAMFGARLRRPPRTGCSSWTSCATRAAPSSSSFAGGVERGRWTPSSGRSRPTPRPTSSARSPTCRPTSAPQGEQIAARRRRTTSRASTSTSPRPSSTRRSCRASTRRSGSPRARSRGKPRRPHRHRRAGGRDLRQGRRRGARQFRSSPTRCRARFGKRKGLRGVPRLPRRRGPGGAGDGARQALPLPGAAEASRAAVARPDKGSLKLHEPGRRDRRRGSRAASSTGLGLSRASLPFTESNALLVSGRKSASGHPLMVAGPQVAYFNPQILMEQDVHAPASEPARRSTRAAPRSSASTSTSSSAAGATTPGAPPRPARTSSTPSRSSSASRTARPTSRRTTASAARCEPIEVLDARRTRGSPTPGDQTRRRARRRCGPSARSSGSWRGRGTVRGKPVIFTKLRSTYFHEVDSAAGFMDFNTPEVVRDAASFQRAASKIGYTFNWFYADAEHIAYFNSGANPVRAAGVDHDFPVARELTSGSGWNPDTGRRASPPSRAPAGVDQPVPRRTGTTARRTASPASDDNAFSSTYRSRAARGPGEGGDRGRAQDDAAAARSTHGGGGDRPTCARTSTCRWRCGSSGARRDPRAARRRRQAARVAARGRPAARPRPRRRLRARRRDPDHGRLVAALGRGPVQAGAGPEAFDAARDRRSSTTRPTTTATTSARPTRAPGTAT